MGINGGTPKRFWAKHKLQAVLRLLRGEGIDLVSRELGVTAATLSQWRDAVLEAGESGLKPHPVKESIEIGRLREMIGEQAMENELLREKIARMEQNRPLALRRSRNSIGNKIRKRRRSQKIYPQSGVKKNSNFDRRNFMGELGPIWSPALGLSTVTPQATCVTALLPRLDCKPRSLLQGDAPHGR